jgi:hypothetical protein
VAIEGGNLLNGFYRITVYSNLGASVHDLAGLRLDGDPFLYTLSDHTLDLGIERHYRNDSLGAAEGCCNRAAQSLTHKLGELIAILIARRMVGEAFNDR